MNSSENLLFLDTAEYKRKIDGFIEMLNEDGRRRLANNIRRYFPPSVTLRLIADRLLDDLASEREIAYPTTIMIIDVRDFVKTIRSIEQRHSGMERGRDLLQRFFDLAVNTIFSYEGMAGEFAGDRIMAVFGIPAKQNDHALRAVQAAIEIEEGIQKRINTRGMNLNANPFNVGIGIHSDTGLYLGDVGSGWRRELIVIGSMVNVTSRIEELTKHPDVRAVAGHNILVSSSAAALIAHNATLASVGAHVIRGYHTTTMDGSEDIQMDIHKVVHVDNNGQSIRPVQQTDELKALVSALAEYIESFSERKRAQKYRSAIENISMLWMSGSDLANILEEVITIVCSLFAAENATLWMVNPERTHLVPQVIIPPGTAVLPKPIGEGYVGAVASSGQPLLVLDAKQQQDATSHSQKDEALARYTVRSMLAVPIMLRGNTVGIIQLLHNQPEKFTLSDEETLMSIAAETALVLEKVQLEQEKHEIQKVSEQLEKFKHLSSSMLEHVRLSLVAQSNPEELLHAIMDGMVAVLSAQYATLYLVDWVQQELEFRVVIPRMSAENLPPRHPFSKGGIAVHVAQSGESVVISDLDTYEGHGHVRRAEGYDKATKFHPRSMMCVPVEARGMISAVLQVMDPEPDKFHEVDLDVLKLLAATAGITLENVLEYRRRTRAEQIASMSLMAGNMVHHFNNEVGLIPPTVEFLSDIIGDWEIPDDQRNFLGKNLHKITTSARNALNYVKIIREPFESKPQPTDVRTAIAEGIRRARVPGDVQITTDMTDDLPLVLASPELNIVFRDLVKNACEAMQSSPEKHIHIQTLYDGLDMLEVFVTDTGPGISADQRQNLFQSYGSVSTKGEANMGFGLFLANYYIEVMGGTLSIDGSYQGGAKFRVTLQVAKDLT